MTDPITNSALLFSPTNETGNGPAAPIGISALTSFRKTGPEPWLREGSTTLTDAVVSKPRQYRLFAHMMAGACAPVGAAGVGASIGLPPRCPRR